MPLATWPGRWAPACPASASGGYGTSDELVAAGAAMVLDTPEQLPAAPATVLTG
ncbi:MAG: hypothetical protein IPF88_14390 [Candidatus Microthrix sp.]|nr:hypothetical protein [Candidatus Microthrix sp.]MBK6439730.1 hypothetical protein [Candidatus Microthrix sp.]